MAEKMGYLDLTRRHDLTPDEVRSCTLFTNMSDEEIKEVIKALKKFTQIVYESYQKRKEKLLN